MKTHCTESQKLVFSGNIVMNSFTRFFFVLTALFVLFAAVPAFAQSSDEDTADRSDRSSNTERTDADRTKVDETPSKPKADKPQDETSDDERRILKDQKESSDNATEIDKLKDIGKNLPDIKEVKPKRPIDPDKIKDFSAIQSVNKSGVSPQVLTRPKGSGSVSGMGLTFQTNLQTGSASLSIPVSIPPARSGTGPSIGLGYSSGAGQGVAGIGWSFGVSYIARQTDQGLPLYDDRLDHFIYGGGHEMVRVAMPSGEEPDFLAGHTYYYYRAKLEGIFMRIFLVNPNTPDSYFVVQDKNGTLYWFGADSDGNRVTSSRVCGNVECEDTFRWNLVQMRDVHGNIVKYTYLKDEEQSYLSKVEYNVHPSDETRFQHAIEMQYGSRSDVLTTYQTGYAVTTALRLVNIRVKSDYGSGGHTLVRRYSFQYMPNSFHSLLKSVTMYGKDDTTHLPPAEFEYSEVDSYYQLEDMGRIAVGITEMDYSPSASLGDGRRDLLDVDADGLPDIYETDPLIPGYIQKYQKNTGGEFQSYREEMPGGNSLLLYNTNIRL
ncbi:hypothetical protein KKF97_00935, partial [Myxococcota bacterium]|nr:hypothetical protein [Myxococcota bacterium]